jgi:hypothetical protein
VRRGAGSAIDPADGVPHLKGASKSIFLAFGADPNPVGGPNHKLAAPQSAEHQLNGQKSCEWPPPAVLERIDGQGARQDGGRADAGRCARVGRRRADFKRYLATRKDNLPWLFVSERGAQLTRQAVNYVVRLAGEQAKLGRVSGPTCCAIPAVTTWPTGALTCEPCRIT